MRRSLAGLTILAGLAAAFFAAIAVLGDDDGEDGPLDAPASNRVQFGEATARIAIVCSLTERAQGLGTTAILGTDGGSSLATDTEDYWLFGDTFVDADPSFAHAPFARTVDRNAADCLDLTFESRDRKPVPLFPLAAGETTAWPEAVIATSEDVAHFYYSGVVRDSPTEWRVTSVGVGRFDMRSAAATREVALWTEGNGVLGVRTAVLWEGYVHAFLFLADNRLVLARVPPERITEIAAYEYWDGASFAGSLAEARPLWESAPGLPAHNGVSARYVEDVGAWVAVYADELERVAMRTAPTPAGPWSEPTVLFECSAYFGGGWPNCYSPELHLQLTDGSTLYMTVGSRDPYDVWLFSIKLER